MLLLHGEMGYHGWLRHHEALAQNNTLHVPTHPGFGASPRLDWIMNIRDLAGWYLEAIDDIGLGQVNLMGSSLGGWLAAEMATMAPDMFKKLVLVAPAGVRPPTGEIFDMFLVVAKEFITESVLDPASTPEFEQVCPEEPSPRTGRGMGGISGGGVQAVVASLHALPRPAQPAQPAQAAAHSHRLGPRGPDNPPQRG